MGYKNKEYQKKYQKEYYKKNKEKQSKYMKKYYTKNSSKIKKYTKTYFSQKRMEQKYNRPIKNVIRERLIKELKNFQLKTALTLESRDFLFTKLVPEKKFYVFENDKVEFNAMQKSKPRNVILNYGDVSQFKEYDMNVDFIYLDFCQAYSTAKETIYLLKDKIKEARVFAVTFCTWDETKESDGDYQFQIVRELQELLDINFKVLFGQGYRDKKHSTMVTIIMENPWVKE